MDGKYSHFAECSKEELQELSSKGGKRSVEVRREKRSMREQMEALLSAPLTNDVLKRPLIEAGYDADNVNNQMAIVGMLFIKACQGEYSALDRLLELIGEGPTQRINVNAGPTELSGILDQLNKE